MRLVFVYNANEGIAAGLMDSVHKIASPATYECGLCAVTHGIFRMDPRWKAWLKARTTPVTFYHRPDFRKAYPGEEIALPAVLTERDGRLAPLVAASEFAAIKTVDQLIATIEDRLAASA